ncbi:MAG: hypothetical protein AAFZ15_07220, partial [Bacteroidota bacterium]
IKLKEIKKARAKNMLFTLLFLQFIYGFFISNIFMLKRFEPGVEKSFVQEVKVALADKNKMGAAITNIAKYSPTGYDMTAYIEADPRICFFCNFLKHVGAGYWANQISTPPSLENLRNKGSATAVRLSPFFSYIQQLKGENKYSTYEDAQLGFIRKYKVDFVIVEKGAPIPPGILKISKEIIEDPYSKTKLIILDNKQ